MSETEPAITTETTSEAGASDSLPRSSHPLDPIFHPRGVAVVGVSSRADPEGRMGGIFLNALVMQGYPKEYLYPVNPKMDEVLGIKCYPSVLDCPDPVDHVISQIPAAGLAELVDQCIQKGVRSIHSFTAGLAETGELELIEAEREIIEKVKAAGVRFIGPNCMGLYVPGVGLSFMPMLPEDPGNVFMLSQSGANANTILRSLGERGLRFSKGVSFGNGADVRAHELLDYALADPQTEYVVGYMEGVQDARVFFERLKQVAVEKPTIILKGGITSDGARAAHSHTGSLAGSIEIFDAMCRQAGAWRAESMDELLDLATMVTTSVRDVKGPNVALIGAGGGFAVLSSDQLALVGLTLPPLPEEVQAELREFVPVAGTSVRNPVDVTFGRDHPLDFVSEPELTRRLFEVIAGSHSTDVILTTVGGPWRPGRDSSRDEEDQHFRAAIEEFSRIQERTGVPIVMVQEERRVRRVTQFAHQKRIAIVPTVTRAGKGIADLLAWRKEREGLPAIL
ncbi:MAG: CoA-binding protein [Dehalococcoidia bacterium]